MGVAGQVAQHELGSAERWLRVDPPLLGEHNLEIYMRELGLSKDAIILLKARGVI